MFGDVLGEGQLDEYTVNGRVIVVLVDLVQELAFSKVFGEMDKLAVDVGLFGGLELHANISAGVGPVTHCLLSAFHVAEHAPNGTRLTLDNFQAWTVSRVLLLLLFDLLTQPLADALGNGSAVNLLSSHVETCAGKLPGTMRSLDDSI